MEEHGHPGAESRRDFSIAALGDFHYDGTSRGELRDIFMQAQREADVLVLCGDMTTHGDEKQIRGFLEEIDGITMPIVAVLGNHDHESDAAEAIARLLTDAGIRLLDGDSVIIDGIGFAGTKGFGGGFGRGLLSGFGERETKAFVQTGVDEALKLERALSSLMTETKVVVLHYSPVVATLQGEPEVIWPFLGTSRLMNAIDTFGASVAFHGHAHIGTEEGATDGGVPVYNVALPVLRKRDVNFRLWSVPAPERRSVGAPSGSPSDEVRS
jgi:Icc-related predicted phosphoesterase